MTSQAQVRSPLLHDGVLLYPNVARTVTRAEAAEVTFAFSLVPIGTAPGAAQVRVLRGTALVGEATLALNPPGRDGRIQQIASLPMPDLGPGTYEVQVGIPLPVMS